MKEEGKSMAEINWQTEKVKYKKTVKGVKKVDLKKYPGVKGFTAVLKAGTEKFKSGGLEWFTIVYVVKEKFSDAGGVNGIPWFTPEDNPTIPKGIKGGEIWLMEVDWQDDGIFKTPKVTVIGYNHKG